MIPLKMGKHKWQTKAWIAELNCHCWDCLRSRGITPDKNSHESHRRNVLATSPLYRTDNGRYK